MTSDRAHSGAFSITHGFLEILDREGLEKVACGCYHADLDNYRRVLPGE